MSNGLISYSIKEPKDYLGGFIATGVIAVVQTITPLLVGQLYKKDDYNAGVSYNPWFTYMWKAMQTGGVVAFGLQALGFFASFIFHFSLFEKLAYLGIWVVHGIALGNLSAITVVGYSVVAIAEFNRNNAGYVTTTEMWITLAVYVAVQLGFAILGKVYALDTALYMVAEEAKDLCDQFGTFCHDYGVLEPTTAIDGSSLLSADLQF